MDNVSEIETTTLRKVALRLMPLLTLGYFLASLDASTWALPLCK